jgi:putative oxidoreductase
MMTLLRSIAQSGARLHRLWSPWAIDALSLALRVLLANVFVRSGMLKIQSWESTLSLFENEYSVPLVSPVIAAWAGTAGEIVLPILLLLGIASRFSATGLFILNAVAAFSYPDISAAGLKDHALWAWWCGWLVCLGAGRASLDHWLCRLSPSQR